jgi:hypothetical protein
MTRQLTDILSRFFNCPVLSDVTIRYGESGELTFHAHKVILSVRSSWFSKVFMSDSRVRS